MKPAAAQVTPRVTASPWDRIRKWASSWSSGGLGVVCTKEIADHTSGIRFLILFLLVGVTGLSSMYVGARTIRDTVAQEDVPYVFLRLFTTSNSLPPFIAFVSFLGPLVGLAMGFDAIVGERNRGTLSRLLSQPIYRDDVINGKFLAGTAMLGWMMGSLGLLVAGLGLILTGVPPSGEEVVRVLAYLMVTVIYVAFWLALGILFSVLFRQAASSALAGIAVWLFFAVFARLLVGLIADTFFPVSQDTPVNVALRNARWQLALGRLSPTVLYEEAIITLLNPSIRTLGPYLLEQVEGAIPGFLSPGQSLLLVWPHLVSLVALTAGVFGVAYYLFIRQEIRA